MRWLVTAFSPFGGDLCNSSEQTLQRLGQMQLPAGIELLPKSLPVSFRSAWPTLKEHLTTANYDGVLALGQSSGRAKLSLEQLAINWVDTLSPDNEEHIPKMGQISEGAPLAFQTKIQWAKLEDSPYWQRSYSAGTFVCNHLMYQLALWSEKSSKPSGFVHIPRLDAQSGMTESLAADCLLRIFKFLVTT